MLFLCTNIAGVLTHYPSEVAKRQVIIAMIIMIIIGKIMIITKWQNYSLLEQTVDILIKQLMKISTIYINIKC